MSVPPPLFTPYTCRGVTWRNRIMLSPMCQYMAEEGQATRWHRAHHARFALGGVGGALLEATAVTRDGRITPGCLGIWSDAHIAGLADIVDLYHDQAIPVGVQLAHAGRKASAAVPWEGAQPLAVDDPRAWPSVAPSALPFGDSWPVPTALDEAGIAAIIESFRAAAARAVRAGFDFVEVHGAHGYLINSFVSTISNRRDDRWGGDRAGRFRLALTVVERLRADLPSGMPIFYRASILDGVEGGVTLEDSLALAGALRDAGADVIDCSSGGVATGSGVADRPPSPGYLVPLAGTVRRESKVATMAVGLILTPEQANAVIAGGHADLVALGRELLADSNFAHRAAQALGLETPHRVLPPNYSFYLERRRYEEA
jgi:2,4-dienoyl-CoA reductase-like NADH-dependent reductase (Old Yellow Enzyme family)